MRVSRSQSTGHGCLPLWPAPAGPLRQSTLCKNHEFRTAIGDQRFQRLSLCVRYVRNECAFSPLRPPATTGLCSADGSLNEGEVRASAPFTLSRWADTPRLAEAGG